MENFLKEKLMFDDLFDRLKQMQNYLFDIKKLELFNLPKPVCLQNAYMLNMYSINNKWSDNFPSLQTIEKFIQDEKKLFYLPEDDYFYYLYYHLLVAYKKFQESGSSKKIYDDETPLDYDVVSNYLTRKNLDATKFFEIYLEKGVVLDEADLNYALLEEPSEESNKVTNKLDEISLREMSSELTAPSLEPEIEVEVPKIMSPLSPLSPLEVDFNTVEEKKIAEEKEEY